MHLYLAVTALNIAWPWYVVRAAGIISVILVLLVMFSGIGMVTGLTYRYIEPLKAWTIHRALGIALVASVLVHIVFLLFDKFAPYSLADITIPFLVHYEHSKLFGLSVGSLYNAVGIIATYLLVIVLISSLTVIESRKRLWHRLHYLSYPLMTMVFFHTLFLGTDFKHGIFRIIWVALGIILLLGLLSRLRRTSILANK